MKRIRSFLKRNAADMYVGFIVMLEIMIMTPHGAYASSIFQGGLSSTNTMVAGTLQSIGPLAFTGGLGAWGVSHVIGSQGAHKYGLRAMAGGALIAVGGYGQQVWQYVQSNIHIG